MQDQTKTNAAKTIGNRNQSATALLFSELGQQLQPILVRAVKDIVTVSKGGAVPTVPTAV